MKRQEGGEAPGWVAVELIETPERCLIEVQDNGCGLPEPTERLTEPYVTMRPTGTGLGLAIVKKIMEEHGGSLTLRNRAAGVLASCSLSQPFGRSMEQQPNEVNQVPRRPAAVPGSAARQDDVRRPDRR